MLADFLFTRSSHFRKLILQDFSRFSEFVVVTSGALPYPKKWAVKLQERALRVIGDWYDKFGSTHRKLHLAVVYLKEHGVLIPDAASLTDIQDIPRTSNESNTWKYKQNQLEIDAMIKASNELVVGMTSLIEILVPSINSSTSSALLPPPTIKDIIDSGLGSHHYTLNLDIPTTLSIPETSENAILFEELRRLFKALVGKRLPVVVDWVDGCIRADRASESGRIIINSSSAKHTTQNIRVGDGVLDRMIDLKERMIGVKGKAEALGITLYGKIEVGSGDDNDSSEEFEEDPVVTNQIVDEMHDEAPLRIIPTINIQALPIIEACGVKLANGKLCSRRDLKSCPVHGKIVARDINGVAFDGEPEVQQTGAMKQPWELIEASVNASLGDMNVMKKRRALVTKDEDDTSKDLKRLVKLSKRLSKG